jgi:hypothetical protein
MADGWHRPGFAFWLSLCVLRILPNPFARNASDISSLRADSIGPDLIAQRLGLSFCFAGALCHVPFLLWSSHTDRISAISVHTKSHQEGRIGGRRRMLGSAVGTAELIAALIISRQEPLVLSVPTISPAISSAFLTSGNLLLWSLK